MVWWDPAQYIVFVSWTVNVHQALRILKNRSADNVSVDTYFTLWFVMFSYLIHAILIKDWVFILSNSLGLTICTWVLILIRMYSKWRFFSWLIKKPKKIKDKILSFIKKIHNLYKY